MHAQPSNGSPCPLMETCDSINAANLNWDKQRGGSDTQMKSQLAC